MSPEINKEKITNFIQPNYAFFFKEKKFTIFMLKIVCSYNFNLALTFNLSYKIIVKYYNIKEV